MKEITVHITKERFNEFIEEYHASISPLEPAILLYDAERSIDGINILGVIKLREAPSHGKFYILKYRKSSRDKDLIVVFVSWAQITQLLDWTTEDEVYHKLNTFDEITIEKV